MTITMLLSCNSFTNKVPQSTFTITLQVLLEELDWRIHPPVFKICNWSNLESYVSVQQITFKNTYDKYYFGNQELCSMGKNRKFHPILPVNIFLVKLKLNFEHKHLVYRQTPEWGKFHMISLQQILWKLQQREYFAEIVLTSFSQNVLLTWLIWNWFVR